MVAWNEFPMQNYATRMQMKICKIFAKGFSGGLSAIEKIYFIKMLCGKKVLQMQSYADFEPAKENCVQNQYLGSFAVLQMRPIKEKGPVQAPSLSSGTRHRQMDKP